MSCRSMSIFIVCLHIYLSMIHVPNSTNTDPFAILMFFRISKEWLMNELVTIRYTIGFPMDTHWSHRTNSQTGSASYLPNRKRYITDNTIDNTIDPPEGHGIEGKPRLPYWLENHVHFIALFLYPKIRWNPLWFFCDYVFKSDLRN